MTFYMVLFYLDEGGVFLRLGYMDSIDFIIISEFKKNSQVKISEIAEKLHLNERSVRRRLDQLIKFGVLEPVYMVNPAFFGYVLILDIFLEVVPQKLAAIEECLLNMKEVFYIAESQNGDELSIQGRFKDNASLFDFIQNKLPAIDGVTVKGYAFIPNIIKSLHQWTPREEEFSENKNFKYVQS